MVLAGSDVAHRLLRNDAASQWLGIEVLALDDGHATITMTLRAEMMNGFGITHGGMVFSLADTAFALACNTADGDDATITVASGVDVNFLLPTRAGQRLTAVANRRHQQGRSGLYDVQVLLDDSQHSVVAEFRGRCRTIPNKQTPTQNAAPERSAQP
ncbi:hydroxyphenylacetyl-CoA thioesterase PaaI [Arthrobacter cryoconiti]|uniref:Hydroxyphenylacetyl-CoA thioesterase PaaI n=1 Tax=Arthrobacter cryoconiti TaxID=748907 RepID=A0ABV8R2H0_9MICC|nr:hydroxyphenylacetyl-CoA thioesterase PaaI [Arthrobacter cryoconiti]MCC9068129.1 hydroxyphenylacetyl-CoA thioesterase PaaI [Arthrobacter cryoconiti]